MGSTAKELTKKVKELALANDLDYVGIAPVQRLTHLTEGHKATDFLPEARSVIVIGMRLGVGVQLSNKLAHVSGELRHAIYPYLWYGLGLPNMYFLDVTALLICQLIERGKADYVAVPIPSFSPFDLRDSLAEFSNVDAAVAAGIGEPGWNRFVLTPDVGPRARFTSVITNAALAPDPMYTGPQLCNPEKCGYICAKVCPVGALSLEGEEMSIGDRMYRRSRFDKWKCMWCSLGLTKESLCLLENPVPMPETVTLEGIRDALRHQDAGQASEVMVIRRADYCGKCIMECPVGNSPALDEVLGKVSKGG